MKSVVPVVMAGILGIYGMIVAVIIVQKSTWLAYTVPASGYSANAAYAHLASGLCCGFSSLVSFSNNYRLLDWQLGLLVMPVSAPMLNKIRSLSEWS